MAKHWGNGVDDAARLELALERIHARAARPATAELPPAADPALQEAAQRLDGVIAEIRAALGKNEAGKEP